MLTIKSPVFETARLSVPYLRSPGMALISQPQVDLTSCRDFLDNFDPAHEFNKYLDDPTGDMMPGEQLIKFSGQVCYLSLDAKRTYNKDVQKYITNILSSGHGSVLEHAQYSFMIWGISRSVTHELVRHRTGVAYSQVSQRYVDGTKLRFVERPEFVGEPRLHQQFEDFIEEAKSEYDCRAERLAELLAPTFPDDMPKTDRRKRVNQAARSCLPNETEAPIVVSGNIRALRHIVEMRAAGPAEVEIRRMTYGIYQIMKEVAPHCFADYEVVELSDGTKAVKTQYRKV